MTEGKTDECSLEFPRYFLPGSWDPGVLCEEGLGIVPVHLHNSLKPSPDISEESLVSPFLIKVRWESVDASRLIEMAVRRVKKNPHLVDPLDPQQFVIKVRNQHSFMYGSDHLCREFRVMVEGHFDDIIDGTILELIRLPEGITQKSLIECEKDTSIKQQKQVKTALISPSKHKIDRHKELPGLTTKYEPFPSLHLSLMKTDYPLIVTVKRLSNVTNLEDITEGDPVSVLCELVNGSELINLRKMDDLRTSEKPASSSMSWSERLIGKWGSSLRVSDLTVDTILILYILEEADPVSETCVAFAKCPLFNPEHNLVQGQVVADFIPLSQNIDILVPFADLQKLIRKVPMSFTHDQSSSEVTGLIQFNRYGFEITSEIETSIEEESKHTIDDSVSSFSSSLVDNRERTLDNLETVIKRWSFGNMTVSSDLSIIGLDLLKFNADNLRMLHDLGVLSKPDRLNEVLNYISKWQSPRNVPSLLSICINLNRSEVLNMIPKWLNNKHMDLNDDLQIIQAMPMIVRCLCKLCCHSRILLLSWLIDKCNQKKSAIITRSLLMNMDEMIVIFKSRSSKCIQSSLLHSYLIEIRNHFISRLNHRLFDTYNQSKSVMKMIIDMRKKILQSKAGMIGKKSEDRLQGMLSEELCRINKQINLIDSSQWMLPFDHLKQVSLFDVKKSEWIGGKSGVMRLVLMNGAGKERAVTVRSEVSTDMFIQRALLSEIQEIWSVHGISKMVRLTVPKWTVISCDVSGLVLIAEDLRYHWLSDAHNMHGHLFGERPLEQYFENTFEESRLPTILNGFRSSLRAMIAIQMALNLRYRLCLTSNAILTFDWFEQEPSPMSDCHRTETKSIDMSQRTVVMSTSMAKINKDEHSSERLLWAIRCLCFEAPRLRAVMEHFEWDDLRGSHHLRRPSDEESALKGMWSVMIMKPHRLGSIIDRIIKKSVLNLTHALDIYIHSYGYHK